MPDIDLFGETQGKVRNQKERINQDKIYSHYKPFFLTLHNNYDDRNDDTRGNDVFTKKYLDRELRKINGLFAKISHYPITTYSKKYKENIEAFTEECLKETDAIPIMISNTYNDIRIDMLTSDDQIYPTLYLLGEKQEASGESKNKVMEIAKRFGLNPSSHMNYLP